MSRFRSFLGVIISLIILAASLSPPIKQLVSWPEKHTLVVGEQEILACPSSSLWRNLQVTINSRSTLGNMSQPSVAIQKNPKGLVIRALNPGSAKLELSMFGYIPLKEVNITTNPRRRVLVGGQSVGIILKSRGIMVVGFAAIKNGNGQISPAKAAGMEIGDIITRVNGVEVDNENQLALLIDQIGHQNQPLTLSIKRGEKAEDITVKPVYCQETMRYRVGLYVRDGVAGVGTLSFVDPATLRYAALGHVILDADTRQQIEVGNGRLVEAVVQTIQPGRPGKPGEKIGVFRSDSQITGNVKENTYFGIYGELARGLSNPLYPEPLEVAYAHQVHPGPAKMLTVLGGSEVQSFDVMIEKVYPHRDTGKCMVIKVVDPRLIAVAGGIVQGMSGSPLVQDNRMIGVVTHVFLHDPRRGYGVFMDYMLKEMDGEPSLSGREEKSKIERWVSGC